MINNAHILGISGLSGSGKTFYIEKLKAYFGDKVCLLSFDDYYKPLEEQTADEQGIINFDLPDSLYHEKFREDLIHLTQNRPVIFNKYQFQNYDAPPVVSILEPAPIIIAEGLFIFDFPDVDSMLDLRIFIETDLEISLKRRLLRDMEERGISEELSLYQWNNHVLTAFEKHILPHKGRCDMVINNNHDFEPHLKQLTALIEKRFML